MTAPVTGTFCASVSWMSPVPGGMERHLPSPFDLAPRYSVKVDDHFWRALYLPIARGAELLARTAGRIQQGRISIYLTYSFCTLLALLFFVR